MQRRRLLAFLAGAGTVGLAGCNRPDTAAPSPTSTDPGTGTADSTGSGEGGVYVQPFVESMERLGSTTAGPYDVALFYTVPHRFWTVTNGERSVVPKGGGDDGYRVHLMAVVWDPESGLAVPETGLTLELEQGDRLVSEAVIYPMLSQRMGVHYGGNFTLPADGDYRAGIEVGGLSIRRTGAFRDRFGESASAEIPFRFTAADSRRVGTREIPEAGDPGAVAPMATEVPLGRAPDPDALPGTRLGTARSGDAIFEVFRLTDPPAGVDGSGPYLAVSARTRYNGFVLPAMRLSATVGEFEGDLVRTLDPDLGYHYGTAVSDLDEADRLNLTVETPPHIGRHEGYERAFVEMPPTELSI
ncbi:hypothetical protein BV210_10205 [Halorientalis sp. IM1011]|uniref:DUF7350 domain-containing protein n=1 Tax=Halorientalis sp. IM1011 TaxID=1932360 RepID=UPI00097CD2B5|nr:hypothetical protein [Halorientalis sp. IM1011]AQL43062.1 hypothetical protein BV210_10205 [Halorientalis sp. IM1011]